MIIIFSLGFFLIAKVKCTAVKENDHECQEDLDIVDVVNCLLGFPCLLRYIIFSWWDRKRLAILGLAKQRNRGVHCYLAGHPPALVAPHHCHTIPRPLKREVSNEAQGCDERHCDVVCCFGRDEGVKHRGVKTPEQNRRNDVGRSAATSLAFFCPAVQDPFRHWGSEREEASCESILKCGNAKPNCNIPA